jgi:hypothetical protein
MTKPWNMKGFPSVIQKMHIKQYYTAHWAQGWLNDWLLRAVFQL